MKKANILSCNIEKTSLIRVFTIVNMMFSFSIKVLLPIKKKNQLDHSSKQ